MFLNLTLVNELNLWHHIMHTTFAWEFKGAARCLLCLFPELQGLPDIAWAMSGNLWPGRHVIRAISLQWQSFRPGNARNMHQIYVTIIVIIVILKIIIANNNFCLKNNNNKVLLI